MMEIKSMMTVVHILIALKNTAVTGLCSLIFRLVRGILQGIQIIMRNVTTAVFATKVMVLATQISLVGSMLWEKLSAVLMEVTIANTIVRQIRIAHETVKIGL